MGKRGGYLSLFSCRDETLPSLVSFASQNSSGKLAFFIQH